jgi:hypothetical protein
MDDETSTEQRDSTRGRSGTNSTAKAAGAIVIGAVVLLALLRGAFRGRVA